MDYKEKYDIIISKGYRSLTAYSKAAGDNVQNVRKAMLNQRNMTIKMLVQYANALNGDIKLAIDLFAENEIRNLKNSEGGNQI